MAVKVRWITVRLDWFRCGRHGAIRFGTVRFGRFDMARLRSGCGGTRFGMADRAWQGPIWFGTADGV